ncbi:hypothetical protein BGX24_001345 [Mortierella sp. AD032]|nr:hypothetical protein BGX24_001345 [Mortierella sp. AD032]
MATILDTTRRGSFWIRAGGKGREMGMDLSKIGHANDLQEWFDDRYGLPTSAFMHKEQQQQQHIRPKLLLLWFEYSTISAEGYSVRPLKEIKESMAKDRPHVDFRLTRYHPDDY